MSILIFIIILAILILAHEFGHFIVAKKSGVRVDEFGLGFPPKLYGKKFGETEYTINAIPFGGFVKIFGENPDDLPAATSTAQVGITRACLPVGRDCRRKNLLKLFYFKNYSKKLRYKADEAREATEAMFLSTW